LSFTDRLRHAWNTFRFSEANRQAFVADLGPSYAVRPDRPRVFFANEKTIVTAIYTRLSIDVAAIPIRHVRLDDNKQYMEDMSSALQECLTVEANIDQGATQFRQDLVQTLLDEGVAAILPVDTTLNPLITGGYDISTMRVGRVIQWFPRHVKVRAYDDNRGVQDDVIVPKSMVAIVENPLYSVMNETSSTLQRLIRKLRLLDAVDDQSASGKLDIIIQLPYTIKTEAKREQAEIRRKEIEFQLTGSKYGIAYADATERITQLNRPVENNLLKQVEYLTTMLYGQLGLTEGVMNGTADEATMINYYNRSVKPILVAVVEAMTRTFLTKTARSQGQVVTFFRDPFTLVPVKELAEIADKFTRNEVLSSNEMRAIIGWRPSKDPKADKLLNKNLPAPPEENASSSVVRTRPPLAALPGQALAIEPPTPRQGATSQNGS
jgi:Phage portal protein